MKNDGKDAERFRSLLKTVVNVPKAEVKKLEEKQAKEKTKLINALQFHFAFTFTAAVCSPDLCSVVYDRRPQPKRIKMKAFQYTLLSLLLLVCTACTNVQTTANGSLSNKDNQNTNPPLPADTPKPTFPIKIDGKASSITDGDTLIVQDKTGFKTIIRLEGIDAPEFDQPFGQESKELLMSLVQDKIMTVESNKLDRYGRTVGVIKEGRKDICLEMIRQGFAWHFKRYEDEQTPEDRKAYADAEIGARRRQIGLWKDRNPKAPWVYRDEQRASEASPISNSNGN